MKIRKARPEDAKEIRRIIEELNIKRDSSEKSGFVEYPVISIEDYEQRIEISPFCHVAEKNNKIIGFSLVYPSTSLTDNSFEKDEIVRFVNEEWKNFIYWDQIAVAKEFQNEGIGKKLCLRLLEDVKKTKFDFILGPVSHWPHENKISVRLLTWMNFELVKEIEVYNGLRFGIYRKDL